MIEIKNLTMQYPNGKGIFDVDLNVGVGTAVGFLGPNGAGKTTTIRCLLGFMRGSEGTCTINGQDCFDNAHRNMLDIGFIAGEPSFPDGMTGMEYLNFLCEIRKGSEAKLNRSSDPKDNSYAANMRNRMGELIEYFEFDPKGKINRMSKGMKQKTAIVAAFMHDPNLLILDEPTSGLDPLMQNKFVDLLLREKKKGKTILMSSHMFEEVERTCEQVVIIKDGRIVASDDVKNLKTSGTARFVVTSPQVAKIKLSFPTKKLDTDKIEATVPFDKVDKFIKEIAKYNITWLKTQEQSLENIFLDMYKKEGA